MISIKTPHEIAIMKQAGKIINEAHRLLASFVIPGMSTFDLDLLAKNFYQKKGVISAFKGYNGFPKHICASVNEVVVHGIPSKKTILKQGDIITLDLGINYQGYYVDCAYSYAVGTVCQTTQNLLLFTQKALLQGLLQIKPQNHFSDISHAIELFAKKNNLGIVEEFTGHGIGTSLHEEPYIPNFGKPHEGEILQPGMTFCVEPMLTLGKPEIAILQDNWTVVTIDKSLSSHFEHTVLVTPKGYEILA
ncbi:Methionine aminopeptidase [Candidatus Phytoplasma asteris]|uniref:Methionine aminopeptidase n=1 Tax=Candidatus Phytoplasma asteris TaxID=85620 RepID=A0ABZ2YFG1_9MOLU